MLHRSTLDKASRPGLRFQGWKALPLGSKIAIIVLGLIALIAVLAPVVAPLLTRCHRAGGGQDHLLHRGCRRGHRHRSRGGSLNVSPVRYRRHWP